jgi:hypothetical protein
MPKSLMSLRILTALLGGLVVTTGLLFAMSEVTERFRERDPTEYFRIDFIPWTGGRRLPPPPPAPSAQPDRPQVDYGPSPATRLSVEPPGIEKPEAGSTPTVPNVPDLDADESR